MNAMLPRRHCLKAQNTTKQNGISVARNVGWPREAERDTGGQDHLCNIAGLQMRGLYHGHDFLLAAARREVEEFEALLSTKFEIRTTGRDGDGSTVRLPPRP